MSTVSILKKVWINYKLSNSLNVSILGGHVILTVQLMVIYEIVVKLLTWAYTKTIMAPI